MEPLHVDYITAELRHQRAQAQQDFYLFSMLKPRIQRDGNQWCVLYGDDLQVGIAGFGDTPHLAIIDFNAQWYKTVQQKH